MKIKMVALSDAGTVREYNEDSYGIFEQGGLALVCDGMGGHNAGAQASQLAVSTIKNLYLNPNHYLLRQVTADLALSLPTQVRNLIGAIRLTNRLIYNHNHSRKNTKLEGMGTTVAALALANDMAIMVHVGDSRIYRIRKGEFVQLTEDHSWVNELLADHEIDAEDVQRFEEKNVITRALGLSPSVKIDLRVEPARKGDLYLLCTDGLSGSLDNEEIYATLIENNYDLDISAIKLIYNAKEKNGSDNITVSLVKVIDLPDNQPAMPSFITTLKEESEEISVLENRIIKGQHNKVKSVLEKVREYFSEREDEAKIFVFWATVFLMGILSIILISRFLGKSYSETPATTSISEGTSIQSEALDWKSGTASVPKPAPRGTLLLIYYDNSDGRENRDSERNGIVLGRIESSHDPSSSSTGYELIIRDPVNGVIFRSQNLRLPELSRCMETFSLFHTQTRTGIPSTTSPMGKTLPLKGRKQRP